MAVHAWYKAIKEGVTHAQLDVLAHWSDNPMVFAYTDAVTGGIYSP
jgi:hypothetical protein